MAAGPHTVSVPAQPSGLSDRTRSRVWIAVGVAGFALLAWMLSFAETGVDEVRVANPDPPNPVPVLEWAGQSATDFWVPIFYGVTFAVMGLMGWIFWRYWRQTKKAHAGLPIFIALGVVGFIGDPIFNWAMYCNYHPDLLHWPVNWNLMNVAPSVEPLWIVMGAYQVFFLAPAMAAFALYGRFVARRAGPDSWVKRHPGWSLLIFASVFGFGMDILMEQWMLNMGIYKYTQIAGPAMTWGHGHLQVYEILWIGVLIGFYATLLQRDDTGIHRLQAAFAEGTDQAARARGAGHGVHPGGRLARALRRLLDRAPGNRQRHQHRCGRLPVSGDQDLRPGWQDGGRRAAGALLPRHLVHRGRLQAGLIAFVPTLPRVEQAAQTSAAPKQESLRQYVAAARRCFDRDGVTETRMEDIAQEAGLSRQYLYRLVSGREELIEMAMIDRAREFTDELAVRAERLSPDGNLEEAFIDQIVFAISLGRDDPEFVKLARALPRERANHALTGADSPFHDYTVRAFEPLFARAMSEGTLRTDVTVDAMVDWLQGVLALLSGRDDLDDQAERRVLREFVLPSLLRT